MLWAQLILFVCLILQFLACFADKQGRPSLVGTTLEFVLLYCAGAFSHIFS